MELFQKGFPPLIGLDISATSVKLLELSLTGGRYRVESYAVAPIPENAIKDKNISDIKAVGGAIERAVRRAGTRTKQAAVAVAGSAVISKIVTMPANLSDAELEDQIKLEADQYIPFPLNEVYIDFQVLGPNEQDPATVNVLLAACRSETVEERVAALEVAGLVPRIVDVEAYAMETMFSLLGQQLSDNGVGKTVAVVDVGASMTTLTVSHDFKVIFTRDQMFGGKQLTEEIMRRYGLSYEEAGMAKRQGGLPDNYESEVLMPFKESLAQQVSRALQYFFSSGQHSSVDHLILAGGCAALPSIDEMVEDKLGIPTSIANPFANMSLASRIKADVLNSDAPALVIACGLAMRRFDKQ